MPFFAVATRIVRNNWSLKLLWLPFWKYVTAAHYNNHWWENGFRFQWYQRPIWQTLSITHFRVCSEIFRTHRCFFQMLFDSVAFADEISLNIPENVLLGDCENYNGLYLCDTYVLQLYHTAYTCASSLFYDASPGIIAKHCAFEFIFQIRPPPCLLHSDKHLLLSGNGALKTCAARVFPIN